MTDTRTRIGIDFRGDLFYVARVDHHAGRPEIKALVRLERQHLSEHHLLKDGSAVISIPDHSTLLRKIRIDSDSDDFEARARFELAQSVLEDEKEFYFDILPTPHGYHLGLALRRKKLDQTLEELLQDQKGAFPGAGYKTRGAALADGYISFCRTGSGSLICLADFLSDSVSIALVYDSHLLDLVSLPIEKYNLASDRDLSRLAIEFKTSINYKLSSIFAAGITTPLAGLFVSGDAVDGRLTELLKSQFSVEIAKPRINAGFFTGQNDLSSVPLERYLVALGLAAD